MSFSTYGFKRRFGKNKFIIYGDLLRFTTKIKDLVD